MNILILYLFSIVIILKKTKSSYYESFKSEGDWDSSKSNNNESSIRKHKELQNLWSQYFRDGKTESDLIKDRPPFLLKRKLSIIFRKDSEIKEHTLEKKSGRKCNWADDIKITLKKFMVKIAIYK